MLTFINDILQINKIEANKVELDPEIFNTKGSTLTKFTLKENLPIKYINEAFYNR